MNKEELKRRTKAFALRVLKLIRALQRDAGAKAIAAQLVRAGMSVGANYRASLRARSRAEWISKLNLCLEESDETEYWLELVIEDEILPAERVQPLLKEAGELTAIFAAALKTSRTSNDGAASRIASDRRSKS